MTALDLDELRRVAEDSKEAWDKFCGCTPEFERTFNPAVCLALLDRVAKAEQQAQIARDNAVASKRRECAMRDKYSKHMNGKTRQENERLRAQVKALREALERIGNPFIAAKASIANRIAREALATAEPKQ